MRCSLLALILAGSAFVAAEPGHQVGVETDGRRGSFAALLQGTGLDAAGGQVLDYTFGSAPTDWAPVAGEWTVSSRFACDPTWSFFGGHSRGLALIWNKRHFVGDVLVEAYVAFKHGLPYNPQAWSYRPADLCLTICGNGQDPASGYSFIYGADEGSRTVLRRGDQILADTSDPLFITPSYADTRPDTDAFHRRWWRLEARRVGQRLEFWVDGRKALEYTDPNPLEGGQIAVWTVRNGLMIARVRVCYADERLGTTPAVHIATPAPLPTGDGSTAVATAPQPR